MVAPGGVTFDLRKFPKDDFERFRNAVLNGKSPAMPAWRDRISDDDVKLLWAYVLLGRAFFSCRRAKPRPAREHPRPSYSVNIASVERKDRARPRYRFWSRSTPRCAKSASRSVQ
jgi:hypothetical protein